MHSTDTPRPPISILFRLHLLIRSPQLNIFQSMKLPIKDTPFKSVQHMKFAKATIPLLSITTTHLSLFPASSSSTAANNSAFTSSPTSIRSQIHNASTLMYIMKQLANRRRNTRNDGGCLDRAVNTARWCLVASSLSDECDASASRTSFKRPSVNSNAARRSSLCFDGGRRGGETGEVDGDLMVESDI